MYAAHTFVGRSYGTYRPTLMSLLQRNDDELVKNTLVCAMGPDSLYRKQQAADDPTAAIQAIKELSKLKGIGPATAPLILSAHDPGRVIFFSDEAYYWLCGDGEKVKIKYTIDEYKMLFAQASDLTRRLGVECEAVEKVAFVVINGNSGVGSEHQKSTQVKPEPPEAGQGGDTGRKASRNDVDASTLKKQAKRNADDRAAPEDDGSPLQVRRSKRTRRS
jgi:hypothetical protein